MYTVGITASNTSISLGQICELGSVRIIKNQVKKLGRLENALGDMMRSQAKSVGRLDACVHVKLPSGDKLGWGSYGGVA